MSGKNIILGGGVTGLAAGVVSGWPIYEAEASPGGICSSYYMRPGDPQRYNEPPADGEAYRFEIGGGHWIWGREQDTLEFIRSFARLKNYERLSAVYFPDRDLYVPYPIQNHLSSLPPDVAGKALDDILQGGYQPVSTLADWLRANFGTTLYDLFFGPFHELYCAGLHDQIAPQDMYKSPVDKNLIIKGAQEKTPVVGYNASFLYPEKGLNDLVFRMAAKCHINYGKKVVKINVIEKEVQFDDGTKIGYDKIISTLPLNQMMEITGLDPLVPADPYTSVLVVNIGAMCGPRCPKEHWLYIPRSRSGFHRVGFYSNVDASFLPISCRDKHNRVSIYVERSFRGGEKPEAGGVKAYEAAVVKELQSWGFIEETEVMDSTWIPIAYTWSRPNSSWREESFELNASHSIYQAGRFARWTNQGITESIRQGLETVSLLLRS
ncbi:MAG: FAD-dependent oxidoreductase [Desulfobaccales bacterium]